MKINNNILAVIIVMFIVFSIASTRVILEKIDTITGVATSQSATVLLNITPREVKAPPMGAGAGSGKSKEISTELRIEPSDFLAYSISTFVGEEVTRQVYIKNIGQITTDVQIKSTLEILSFSRERFTLQPNQEEVINFELDTRKQGLFTGKIEIASDFHTKEIPVAVTIRPSKRPFDLYVQVKDTDLRPGEDFIVNVDVKRAEGGFIELRYIIQDATNKAILRVTETRRITDSLSVAKVIRIPRELKAGTYIFAVEAFYKGESDIISNSIKVSRTKRFVVERPEGLQGSELSPIIPIALLIIVIVINFFLFRKRKATL